MDTFTFNAADQLTAVASNKGGTPFSPFPANYTRDAANQLASDSSAASGTGSYKYTPLNQVCYAGSSNTNACSTPPTGSIAYKYDAADNLTQKGSVQQAFNNGDELCWTATTSSSCSTPPTGATSYQYDNRGNRTGVTPPSGPAQTLTYDQANRLTKYAAGSTTSYGYNADGLRMCKVSGSYTQPCQATGNTQHLWDVAGSLPLLLKDGTTTYIYGPGGLPLEQVSGSTTYWFHHDQLGSTRLITDSTGTTQATYTYDPYGNLVASTGTITNPFRFAGQYQDPSSAESGFYYLRARYYDPVTGQFTAQDAMVAGTRQPYTYATGNPLNSSDPTGLNTSGKCISGSVAIGPFAFVGQACLVYDDRGNFGATGTYAMPPTSFNLFQSPSASLVEQSQVSSGDTVLDLAGPFAYISGSVGRPIGCAPVGVVGGVFGGVFGGVGRSGKPLIGGEVGVGLASPGGSIAFGRQDTTVYPIPIPNWAKPAAKAFIDWIL